MTTNTNKINRRPVWQYIRSEDLTDDGKRMLVWHVDTTPERLAAKVTDDLDTEVYVTDGAADYIKWVQVVSSEYDEIKYYKIVGMMIRVS